jgi:hypothetical protein
MILLKEKNEQKESFIRLNCPPEIAILEILKNSKATVQARDILKARVFINKSLYDGVPLTVTRISPNGAIDVGEVSGIDTQDNLFIGDGVRPEFKFQLGKVSKVYQVVFGTASGWFLMVGKESIYVRDY